MKREMSISRNIVGVAVLIIIAAGICLRPSRWNPKNEKTTEVKLTVNGKSIPAKFNDTKASQNVIDKMPFTISFTSSSVDYCGNLGNIEYDNDDIHSGWRNGDIIYMTNGNWFSIFTGGQNSVVPGNITLGHISDKYLDEVKSWRKNGSVSILFEKSENK